MTLNRNNLRAFAESLTLDELRVFVAECARRTSANAGRPASLKPCHQCGEMLGARERRAACPKCGARNRAYHVGRVESSSREVRQ